MSKTVQDCTFGMRHSCFVRFGSLPEMLVVAWKMKFRSAWSYYDWKVCNVDLLSLTPYCQLYCTLLSCCGIYKHVWRWNRRMVTVAGGGTTTSFLFDVNIISVSIIWRFSIFLAFFFVWSICWWACFRFWSWTAKMESWSSSLSRRRVRMVLLFTVGCSVVVCAAALSHILLPSPQTHLLLLRLFCLLLTTSSGS